MGRGIRRKYLVEIKPDIKSIDSWAKNHIGETFVVETAGKWKHEWQGNNFVLYYRDRMLLIPRSETYTRIIGTSVNYEDLQRHARNSLRGEM